MKCVRPTPDSFFGDVPDLYSGKAAEITKDRKRSASKHARDVRSV